MILLRKSQSNTIALTLSELANPNDPNNWLFVFTKEQSDAYTYAVQLVDVSVSPNSYNLFTLIEGNDITFEFLGDYSYICYQMPDNISIDPTDGLEVERGKMRLLDTEVLIPTFTSTSNNNIYNENAI